MLTIRLSRIGKKNKPMYRLIISEKNKDPFGRALEILGSYNPYTKELQAKKERIEYWLNNGAGMSATVNNLLIEKSVIKGEKVKASIARKKKKAEEDEKKTAEAGEKPADEGGKEESSKEEKADEAKIKEKEEDKTEKEKAAGNNEKKTENKPEAKISTEAADDKK